MVYSAENAEYDKLLKKYNSLKKRFKEQNDTYAEMHNTEIKTQKLIDIVVKTKEYKELLEVCIFESESDEIIVRGKVKSKYFLVVSCWDLEERNKKTPNNVYGCNLFSCDEKNEKGLNTVVNFCDSREDGTVELSSNCIKEVYKVNSKLKNSYNKHLLKFKDIKNKLVTKAKEISKENKLDLTEYHICDGLCQKIRSDLMNGNKELKRI